MEPGQLPYVTRCPLTALSPPRPSPKHFAVLRWTRLDSFLALAALLGALALVWVLPAQHPDAAADFSLGQTGAEAAARDAAERLGYDVASWDADAQPQRTLRLVDTLQARFGRRATVVMLSDADVAEGLPVYHWDVDLAEPDGGADGDLRVRLTQQGALWDFYVDSDAVQAAPRVDAEALGFALAVPETDTAFASVPDSVLAEVLRFTQDTLTDETIAPQWGDFEQFVQQRSQGVSVTVRFGRDFAERLARYHVSEVEVLRRAGPLAVDSMSFLDDREAIRVILSGEAEGIPVSAEVDVTAGGALRGLDVEFAWGDDHGIDALMIAFSIVSGVMYVLLGLTLIVYFFRRFMARLVDLKQALLDGIIVAAPLSLFMIVVMGVVNTDSDNTLAVLAGIAFVFVILLVVFTVVMTMLAGSTEALAQDAWASKLRASVLLRKASLLNERVGYALLRGTLAGIALAGLSALLLLAVPLPLRLKEDFNVVFASFPARGVVTFLAAGPTAYTVLAPTLLGVGSFLRLRNLPTWGIALGTALTLTLLGPFTFTLNPALATWGIIFPIALGLTALFLRFDFLTAFVACFFTMVVWSAGNAYVLGGVNPYIDAVIITLVTVGALALGFVGMRSGTTGDDQVDYVPAYVTDLAQQARMKQELEIAHEVQASFLPKKMPDVKHVDMAAMCLAAHEVGGDYYDFIPLEDGRLAVAIGDVSGKGIQAAFFMTLTKGFLRSLVRQVDSPAEVLRRLNALFYESAPRGTFISMIYGILDVQARTFTFARAGHNPLILRRSPSRPAEPVVLASAPLGAEQPSSQFVQPGGMAIGFTSGPRFDARIEEATIDLRVGDVVVLYTDGFSEAMDLKKDLYGDDRLAERIADLGAHPAAEILQGVALDVQRFAGAAPQHDDMTMLVLKLTAGMGDFA